MMIEQESNAVALRIQDTLTGLSDRDRKLLIGLTFGALLAIVVGGFTP